MIVRLTRIVATLLCCALFGTQLAQAKTLTPIQMHQKIEKAKIGTCITIKEYNGTQLKGRILALGPDNFTLELLATDQIVVIAYDDLVSVDTPSYKAAWIIVGVTVGIFVGFTALGIHEFNKNKAEGEKQQHDFCVQNHFPNC